jgi:hypothetical protein
MRETVTLNTKEQKRLMVLSGVGEGVNSTASAKEEHIPDAAIQFYVLAGSGVRPRRARLAYLNKDYIYPGGDW